MLQFISNISPSKIVSFSKATIGYQSLHLYLIYVKKKALKKEIIRVGRVKRGELGLFFGFLNLQIVKIIFFKWDQDQ